MTQKKRLSLAARHGHRCWYCSQQLRKDIGWQNSATIEHVIPRSQGGTNEYWNLVAACHRCNFQRGHEDYEEFLVIAQSFAPDRRLCEHARDAYLKEKRAKRRREIMADQNPQPVPVDFLERMRWWILGAASACPA